MQHVYLLALPESFASGVIGAKDLLGLSADTSMLDAVDGRGELNSPAFTTEIVGMGETVPTSLDSNIVIERQLDTTEVADVVYIPPLAVPPMQEPDCDPVLLEWLCWQYREGALVCAACTGTLALAASGLLDGRPATTHWAYEQTFQYLYPHVDLDASRTLLVGGSDKQIVTAGAHASWNDLMLYLIHRFSGAAVARRIAKIFLLDWHEVDQNAYATFRDNRQHEDRTIQEAQRWLANNLSHPEPIEAVMTHIGLPQRSFHRRFRQATAHTPIRYVQHLRVERAKDLLEDSDFSIEEIAWKVGYEDVAYFRRVFNRITGLSPAKYRKLFRTPANVVEMLPD